MYFVNFERLFTKMRFSSLKIESHNINFGRKRRLVKILEAYRSQKKNDCQNRIVDRKTFSDTHKYPTTTIIFIDKKKLPEILSQLIHSMPPEMLISRPIKID